MRDYIVHDTTTTRHIKAPLHVKDQSSEHAII